MSSEVRLFYRLPEGVSVENVRSQLASAGLNLPVEEHCIERYTQGGGAYTLTSIAVSTASAAVATAILGGLRQMFGSPIRLEIPGQLVIRVRNEQELKAAEETAIRYLAARAQADRNAAGDETKPKND